jgi:hypothetical protein
VLGWIEPCPPVHLVGGRVSELAHRRGARSRMAGAQQLQHLLSLDARMILR